tara:strand:+ start:441 stop:776 length:336 start_codon:yes stop_codon:yes gene_type:complete
LSFLKYIKVVSHATLKQQKNELWDVSGIIKDRSNQEFKFDLRPITKQPNNFIGKKGQTNTKADKMVFDIKDQFIIVDIEELHQYIKEKDLKIVYLDKLISELDWNIILPKN